MQDVEAGAVDPVTVHTLNASRQQVMAMLERRRRRLRCVLLLTSLMTIGTAALAVFYLAQFLYTYGRAVVSFLNNINIIIIRSMPSIFLLMYILLKNLTLKRCTNHVFVSPRN